MKKIFTLFTVVIICYSTSAQRVLTEDFNYNTGNLTGLAGGNVGGGNWANISGTGTPLTVVAGSLTYPGFVTNPTASSNKVRITNSTMSAEDAARSFTAITTGTVYASMLFQLTTGDVSNLAENSNPIGDYFTGFSPSSNVNGYVSRTYIRKGSVANTVNFGISGSSVTTEPVTPIVWSATNYTAADVHLITIAYQFVAGSANDISKLWVDEPFSEVEPLPEAVSVNLNASNPANMAYIFIRQAGSPTANADIDAITVASSYVGTLPLSLTAFNASFNGSNAQLSWNSANELNVKGFSLERSSDGIRFEEVAFLTANNSSLQSAYNFSDNGVKSGINYYRLKIVDKDGTIRYSQIVVVNNRASLTAQLFPNPVLNTLNVTHTKAVKGAAIRIVSIDGKLIKNLAVQTGAVQTGLSVKELIKGNYLLVFENDGSTSTTQFAKQ